MTFAYQVDFRGWPACPCLAEWLPVFETELQRRGLLAGPLHIYQLIGGAPASGGTHTDGGAFDVLDLPGDEDVALARQMGADASWSRPYNWDGHNGMPHIHGVLTGCPHNTPARYQIDAVRAGYDGLGYLGHGAPDTGPRPLSGRTWQEGIAWAKQQEVPPMPKPSPGQIFKATILAACTAALSDKSNVEVPVRRSVQRAAVVAIRTIARRMPTP